ncbi:rCG54488, isoform CRA_b, partial [Rattus norvegicus]
MFNDVVLTSL